VQNYNVIGRDVDEESIPSSSKQPDMSPFDRRLKRGFSKPVRWTEHDALALRRATFRVGKMG
jgi:hypothetical protein